MPVDVHGRWAQALAPGRTLTLAISGTSNGDFFPVYDRGDKWLSADHIVQVTATADCYLAFGVGPVNASASDMLFLLGTAIYKIPTGRDYIAAISKSGAAASLSVTMMQ